MADAPSATSPCGQQVRWWLERRGDAVRLCEGRRHGSAEAFDAAYEANFQESDELAARRRVRAGRGTTERSWRTGRPTLTAARRGSAPPSSRAGGARPAARPTSKAARQQLPHLMRDAEGGDIAQALAGSAAR